jgi:ribonuclease P protein component
MLPRAERLDRSAFARAFENGRVWRHPLLTIRAYRRDGSDAIAAPIARVPVARAAFAVPRKVGKATQRNRMRRRVREVYRLSQWRQEARLVRFDLVFMIGHAAATASDVAIKTALDEQLGRVIGNGGSGARRAGRSETSRAAPYVAPIVVASPVQESPVSGVSLEGPREGLQPERAQPDVVAERLPLGNVIEAADGVSPPVRFQDKGPNDGCDAGRKRPTDGELVGGESAGEFEFE